MNMTEAAEKWGMHIATLSYHLIHGHVPSAFKYKPGTGGTRWFIPDDAEKPKAYACCRRKAEQKKPKIIPKMQAPFTTQEQEAYIRMHAVDKTYREICEATGLTLSEARQCYDRLHALYGC